MRITFTVFGEPKPAGSKRAMPIYRRGPNGRQLVTRENGSPMIAVIDDNPDSKAWKQQVACAARQAYCGELLDGPLRVSLHFYRPRPKGHFGANGLNKQGRDSLAPTTKPDVLKLARGVEDALSKVIYRDDSQIVAELITKDYGEPARCEVIVEEMAVAVPLT